MKKQELTHSERLALLIICSVFFILTWMGVFGYKEYNYVVAGETTGTICSEGYIERYSPYFSRQSKYKYSVEYVVDGKKYISNDYRTGDKELRKGELVQIHYKQSDPGKVVEVAFPISWFILLVGEIMVIFEYLKLEKNR